MSSGCILENSILFLREWRCYEVKKHDGKESCVHIACPDGFRKSKMVHDIRTLQIGTFFNKPHSVRMRLEGTGDSVQTELKSDT